MRSTFQRLFLLLGLTALFCPAIVQGDAQHRTWPLTVAAFHTSLAHPRMLEREALNPGLQLGTEHAWIDGERFQLLSTANLGAYHHHLLQSGLYLNSELCARYRTIFHLEAEALLGLGYLHTFETGPVFRRGDDGSLRRAVELGRPHAMPSFAVGLGFAPPPPWQLPAILTLRARLFLEMPWSVGSGVLVLPHAGLALGLRIPIDQLLGPGAP